ncbi:hypothetical protein [Methylobacterium radiotolerans]|uniref:hypothetical protein n=1 Tax=Methylobacterium radiotolerans TaxID=31998 RepID=UPI0038D1FE99
MLFLAGPDAGRASGTGGRISIAFDDEILMWIGLFPNGAPKSSALEGSRTP